MEEPVKSMIMRWTLRAKLLCNQSFYELIMSTNDWPIVENSRKDRYWGAVPEPDGMLVGENALGRLLMELRRNIRDGKIRMDASLRPLSIENFTLLGEPMPHIRCLWLGRDRGTPGGQSLIRTELKEDMRGLHHATQPPLF